MPVTVQNYKKLIGQRGLFLTKQQEYIYKILNVHRSPALWYTIVSHKF